MAHILMKAGCRQNHVSQVIQKLAAQMGIKVIGSLSRRSVGQIALEGSVDVELQLAFELKHTPSESYSHV